MNKANVSIMALAALLGLASNLNAAEDPAPQTGSFAAADVNKDGLLDRLEYISSVSGRLDAGTARVRFDKLDKNRDGMLSRQEMNVGLGPQGKEAKLDKAKGEAPGKAKAAEKGKADAAKKSKAEAGKSKDKAAEDAKKS